MADDPRTLLDATVDRHASVCGRHDSGQNLEECRCGDPRRAVHQLSDALRAVLDTADQWDEQANALDRPMLPNTTDARQWAEGQADGAQRSLRDAAESIRRAITTALEGDHD